MSISSDPTHPKMTDDADDVEGHSNRRSVPLDDDVEGHSRMRVTDADTDDDVEGHRRSM